MPSSGKSLTLSSLSAPPPSLRELSRGIDEGTILPLCSAGWLPEDRTFLSIQIASILADLSEWYGATIGVSQLPALAEMIIRSYPHMYVDDLRIFADEAKRCAYGKLYGSLSPHTVMEWLAQYWHKRSAHMEEEAYSEHLSRKEPSSSSERACDTFQFSDLKHKLGYEKP